MDLIKFAQLLSTSNLRSYRDDDYWIDRLCHRYSVILFSIFAILVTSKAYIGDPIDCWSPPEFKASYERYAETLCFVNGTYYISATEIDIPNEPNTRYSNRVRYYQWTPFILLLQAFTMYLPRLLWLSLNTKYGINLRNLVDAAKKYETVDSYSNKEKILVYICKNLLRTIQFNESTNNKRFLNSYLNRKLELDKILNQKQPRKSVRKKHSKSSSSSESAPYFIIDPNLTPKKLNKYLNSANLKLDTPISSLQSKIAHVSRKHFLNILSTGYELNNFSTHETNSLLLDQKKPIAYLLNKDLVKNFSNEIIDYDTKQTKTNLLTLSRTYLSSLYLFTKLFYLLVSVAQIFFLSRLIGKEFFLIGVNLIKSFILDIEWPHMDIFPRMTLCEIYIREVGTVHPYLIQCVLRINLFNEVIFVVVWYWLTFVVGLTGLDLVFRVLGLILSCSNCRRKLFALKYLELIHLNTLKSAKRERKSKEEIYFYDKIDDETTSCLSSGEEETRNIWEDIKSEKYILVLASQEQEFDLFEKFCQSNFNNDTLFALKVIEQNVSSLIVSEIIEYLWLQFKYVNCVYSSEMNDFILKKLVAKKQKKIKRNLVEDYENYDNMNMNISNDYDVPPADFNNKEKQQQHHHHASKIKIKNRKAKLSVSSVKI